MRWDFVVEILPRLGKASFMTLELTVAGITGGIIIGLVLSILRISNVKPLSLLSKAYVDFFRGTPLLVQIMIVHYILFPAVGVNNALISSVTALCINSGAYVAEIFRGGIQSINKGQMEAARSLGMTWWQAMQHVILPQAFKVSIPPLGNEFIALLKDSSLVSVLAVEELMCTGRLIIGRIPLVSEVWFSVAIIYLILTSTISVFVNYTERRLQTGEKKR